MPKMYNIIKNTTLDYGAEFCMSLRYGDPLSDEVIENLVKYVSPTVSDYDEYVGKIWDFKYITGISEPIHVWVQELKKQNIYMTFASLDNGKFVPYFNETLRVNLDFIDVVNNINNK
jgi:hypothetical protein